MLEAVKRNPQLHTVGEVSLVLVGQNCLWNKPQQHYYFGYHIAAAPFL